MSLQVGTPDAPWAPSPAMIGFRPADVVVGGCGATAWANPFGGPGAARMPRARGGATELGGRPQRCSGTSSAEAAVPDAQMMSTASEASCSSSSSAFSRSWAGEIEELGNFVRQESGGTERSCADSMGQAPSDCQFAEPSQTMIMFDWDDTLFPTTELCDRRQALDPVVLGVWQDALCRYLEQACELSDAVLIITNSRRPWVDRCIDEFVPGLRKLFDREHRAPKVVYARERLPERRTRKAQCMNLRPVRIRTVDLEELTQEEVDEELTFAKYEAMRQEVSRFYSLYPGQSWKNIVSLGDMPYERDAVQEVAFRHVSEGKENLRLKTMILPTEPTLSEITLRLQFCTQLMLAYVRFDGCFDLDLRGAADPLCSIADALRMPRLAELSFSRHAWDREVEPDGQEEVRRTLLDVAAVVQEFLVQ